METSADSEIAEDGNGSGTDLLGTRIERWN